MSVTRIRSFDPYSMRWTSGRVTIDDPDTGRRVDLRSVVEQAPLPVALPPAAQAVLDGDPGLTRDQAAAFLAVSPATLAEWASKQRGPPYFDIGAAVRYPLSGLIEWRARQIKNAIAPPHPASEPAPAKRPRGRPPRKVPHC